MANFSRLRASQARKRKRMKPIPSVKLQSQRQPLTRAKKLDPGRIVRGSKQVRKAPRSVKVGKKTIKAGVRLTKKGLSSSKLSKLIPRKKIKR